MLVVVMMIMGLVVIEMRLILNAHQWEGQVRQVGVRGALALQRVIRSSRRLVAARKRSADNGSLPYVYLHHSSSSSSLYFYNFYYFSALLRLAPTCLALHNQSPFKDPGCWLASSGTSEQSWRKKVASFYFLSFVYLQRKICWPNVNIERSYLSFQKPARILG